jgi:hypothetical protein
MGGPSVAPEPPSLAIIAKVQHAMARQVLKIDGDGVGKGTT